MAQPTGTDALIATFPLDTLPPVRRARICRLLGEMRLASLANNKGLARSLASQLVDAGEESLTSLEHQTGARR